MTTHLARAPARIAIPIFAVLLALLIPLYSASALPLTWALTEYQPDIPQGGRGNTIAVHPTDNNVMLVASETGGLFRTGDGGTSWSHVDSFVPYATGAVAFLRANPNILIATASADFAVANGGGIWRSTDGGASWTQIPHPPMPAGSTTRFSAGEISIAPDSGTIYVATSYGISISADQGATWTTTDPFGGQGVSSVLALSGNRVLAGQAWSGIRRSMDGGASWGPAITSAGGISDMHAFGRSPLAADQAYVVNSATQLFVTEDAGVTWTAIASAPTGGGGCGGISFVKAVGSRLFSPFGGARDRLQLYFGNRCGLFLLTPPRITGTNRFDYSGAWTAATMDHGDTRDLAFGTSTRLLAPRPLLLTTDGGLHKTSDGGLSWSFTGGGVKGYNALQITEVKGQWINDVHRYDLYFGTQDNDNRASTDTGVTWPGRVCCEGFFFELQKKVDTAANTQVTFVSCGPCNNLFSGATFGGLSGWSNPAGAIAGNPAIISQSFHVQGVNTDGGFTKGFAVTRDRGATWQQYVTLPEDRRDMPRLSRRSLLHGFSTPVQYQSIRTGWDSARNFEIDHLVRLVKNLRATTASAYYPAMNGFGGLGINPTMFAWYQVFGVDPANNRYLIAPDIVNEKMMQSADGGENWTDMPALTALVTDGGRYQFRSSIFPHASAVSYYGADSNMVAVGTHQNGIMLSSDHGASWNKVPDSEHATYITSIEWRTATDAFVSTYGRGLWRLQGTFWIPDFPPLCRWVDCHFRFIDRGDPPPFDRGIAVFEGRIQGIRAEQGRVTEVFVTPGSSIGFLAKAQDAPKVRVTESQKAVGLQGDLPKFDWPQSEAVIAVALDKEERFLGVATAKQELPTRAATGTPQREGKEPREDSRRQSPTATRPYISLTVASGRFDAITPGDVIVITGERISADTPVEILLDGQSIGKASANANGQLNFKLKAPEQLGLHTLTVRDARTQKIIDGTMFIVTHRDEKERDEKRRDQN